MIPQRDSVAAFVPLVPAVTGESECNGPYPTPDGKATIYGLRFHTEPRRQIAVLLDEQGKPKHYNDMRGPIRMPGVQSEPRDHTGVTIDLEAATTVLQNVPISGEAEIGRYEAHGALEAPSLDVPQRWIEEILARCVGAAPFR